MLEQWYIQDNEIFLVVLRVSVVGMRRSTNLMRLDNEGL